MPAILFTLDRVQVLPYSRWQLSLTFTSGNGCVTVSACKHPWMCIYLDLTVCAYLQCAPLRACKALSTTAAPRVVFTNGVTRATTPSTPDLSAGLALRSHQLHSWSGANRIHGHEVGEHLQCMYEDACQHDT